jgi:hypothetical protein
VNLTITKLTARVTSRTPLASLLEVRGQGWLGGRAFRFHGTTAVSPGPHLSGDLVVNGAHVDGDDLLTLLHALLDEGNIARVEVRRICEGVEA